MSLYSTFKLLFHYQFNSGVLQLQLFKEEALDANDLLQSLNESIGTPASYLHEQLQESLNSLNCYQSEDM